jgi:hypothetical protein
LAARIGVHCNQACIARLQHCALCNVMLLLPRCAGARIGRP